MQTIRQEMLLLYVRESVGHTMHGGGASIWIMMLSCLWRRFRIPYMQAGTECVHGGMRAAVASIQPTMFSTL